MSSQRLMSEAMALPISEQVSLAQALLQCIDAGLAAVSDAAFPFCGVLPRLGESCSHPSVQARRAIFALSSALRVRTEKDSATA